ncbi:DUF2513 domain-containing protein [Enterococcus thailandicus]|uniref:DUF2513 domain-containing protein n=1 Tax=Enterococcus thailandicus TaxID=417368 RepID=UPI002890FDC7|nr:DUF2513 domain-containing protein [Enterococcus thailandicus]MDT2845530.1 DUF2513 domain-containing protein [Enterococcus thailandicus]
MELKPDLIRDILLYAESLQLGENAFANDINESELRTKYTEDEIIYAISRLGENDGQLIYGNVQYASSKPYIWYIGSPTFTGHQYLENIRDPKIWKSVKQKASLVGSVSLPILSELAVSTIKAKLGLV